MCHPFARETFGSFWLHKRTLEISAQILERERLSVYLYMSYTFSLFHERVSRKRSATPNIFTENGWFPDIQPRSCRTRFCRLSTVSHIHCLQRPSHISATWERVTLWWQGTHLMQVRGRGRMALDQTHIRLRALVLAVLDLRVTVIKLATVLAPADLSGFNLLPANTLISEDNIMYL